LRLQQLLNFDFDDDPDPAIDSEADQDPGPNQDPDLQNWFLLSYFHALIKKENQIYLIYKEIQSGALAKSYLRKGFLIYEEMRKYFPIYEEAVSHI
jgi:hypothetical protein